MMHPERFSEARKSSTYDAAMRHTPAVSTGPLVAFLTFFPVFGLGFLIVSTCALSDSPSPLLFNMVWVLFCLVFIWVGLKLRDKARRLHRAPLERMLGVVVDERTRVSGGGKSSSARTTYYATLQFEDGSRKEYACPNDVAGSIARADIGVAYIKLDYLVGFKRMNG